MENIPEASKEKVKFAYELYDLDEAQKDELRKRVQESDGLVRVFVHPIVQRKDGEPIENQGRVFEVLGRTLSSEKSPPVIILENLVSVDIWTGSVGDRSAVAKDIYIVPTIHDYPYPLVKGKPEPEERDENGWLKDEDFEYVEQGFSDFVKFLDSVGVRKVLIGGTSLEIREGYLTQCVGNFIEYMKKYTNAELKLSLGTAPINRTDIRDLRPDLI